MTLQKGNEWGIKGIATPVFQYSTSLQNTECPFSVNPETISEQSVLDGKG
jgi:hypothetical protein